MTEIQRTASLPEGASFTLCEGMGQIDNRFYLYTPSQPNMTFDMSPMLNSLVYLFTDKPVESAEEAWQVFLRSGLNRIAEEHAIFVAIPIPLNGETWEAADYDNYYNVQYILSGGHIEFHGPGTRPLLQYPRYVYNNKQFVIGEGRGASFICNVLTQNCKRIAGVCTFGGQMEKELPTGLPVPVYLVGACDTAKDYFRAVNETDAVEGDSEYCRAYPLKRVICRDGGPSISEDAVLDAWRRLFSRTARVCVDDNIVCSNTSAKTWILQEWPNYEELGLTEKKHDVGGYVCYDILPKDLPEGPVPLVITCHGGGDDCLYHAHSCGWTQKCAQEKFILISPDYPSGFAGNRAKQNRLEHTQFIPMADHIKDVLEYAKETYEIDTTRVYIAGFSMGSSVSAATALRYLGDFAACCVMGGLGYNDPWYEHHVNSFKAKYDMPFMILSGDEDVMSMDVDYNGNKALFGVHSNNLPINGIDRLLEINKLPYGHPDFAKYGIWGMPVDSTVTRTDKGLNYHVGNLYRPDREPPIGQLVTFEGAGHAHSSFFATLCWDFMSQYARRGDGPTLVLKNHYPRA